MAKKSGKSLCVSGQLYRPYPSSLTAKNYVQQAKDISPAKGRNFGKSYDLYHGQVIRKLGIKPNLRILHPTHGELIFYTGIYDVLARSHEHLEPYSYDSKVITGWGQLIAGQDPKEKGTDTRFFNTERWSGGVSYKGAGIKWQNAQIWTCFYDLNGSEGERLGHWQDLPYLDKKHHEPVLHTEGGDFLLTLGKPKHEIYFNFAIPLRAEYYKYDDWGHNATRVIVHFGLFNQKSQKIGEHVISFNANVVRDNERKFKEWDWGKLNFNELFKYLKKVSYEKRETRRYYKNTNLKVDFEHKFTYNFAPKPFPYAYHAYDEFEITPLNIISIAPFSYKHRNLAWYVKNPEYETAITTLARLIFDNGEITQGVNYSITYEPYRSELVGGKPLWPICKWLDFWAEYHSVEIKYNPPPVKKKWYQKDIFQALLVVVVVVAAVFVGVEAAAAYGKFAAVSTTSLGAIGAGAAAASAVLAVGSMAAGMLGMSGAAQVLGVASKVVGAAAAIAGIAGGIQSLTAQSTQTLAQTSQAPNLVNFQSALPMTQNACYVPANLGGNFLQGSAFSGFSYINAATSSTLSTALKLVDDVYSLYSSANGIFAKNGEYIDPAMPAETNGEDESQKGQAGQIGNARGLPQPYNDGTQLGTDIYLASVRQKWGDLFFDQHPLWLAKEFKLRRKKWRKNQKDLKLIL